MNVDDCCIVLTACINPSKEVYALTLTNSEIRRKQYEDALYFYIYKTKIKNIIFCDNSNSVVDSTLVKKAEDNGKKLELLSFNGNVENTIKKGKGYGEGEILEYVMNNSHLINECKYIVKVTGRLKVLNLDRILKCVYKNGIHINIYNMMNEPFADTKCFIVKYNDFKKKLIKSYMDVDDRNGLYLEKCYGKTIFENNMQYRNFPIYINFNGFSGTSGRQYALSKKLRLKISIEMFFRYVFQNSEKMQPMQRYYDSYELNDNIWRKKYFEYTGMKVAIYGAAKYGCLFYRLCQNHCKVKLWVDRNYKTLKTVYDRKIENPNKLIGRNNIDCIFIAVRSEKTQNEIVSGIRKMNIMIPIEIVKDLY